MIFTGKEQLAKDQHHIPVPLKLLCQNPLGGGGLTIHAGLEEISARHHPAQLGSLAHPAYPFPGRKQRDHQAQTLGQDWDLV